jgi:hypothetical protein
MTTHKMTRTPAVVMDKTPEKEIDPSLCQCTNVQRRWDGDGIAEKAEGVTYYTCSACGKKYS